MNHIMGELSSEIIGGNFELQFVFQKQQSYSIWFQGGGIDVMGAVVECLSNKASEADIADYLSRCDTDFVPPLSTQLDINDYAKKIVSNAMRFEAWSDGILVGLVAVYCNDHETRVAHITSVSVLRELTGKGIASRLMELCIEHVTASGMRKITLDVGANNTTAIKLYEKSGFVVGKVHAEFVSMNHDLKGGEEDDSTCENGAAIYHSNDRKYDYDLDGGNL